MEERKNISYLMQGVEGDEDENIDPNPPPPPPPDTDETPGTPPIGHTNES